MHEPISEDIFESRFENITVYDFAAGKKIHAIKWLRLVTLASKGFTIGLKEAKKPFDELETNSRPILIKEIPRDHVALIKLAGKDAGLVFQRPADLEPSVIW